MKPKFSSDYGGMQCRVCLVREGETDTVRIRNPEDVYQLVKDDLANSDREMLLSVMLATSGHLIGVEVVSIGTLNASHVSPREIFKSAILANACSIILCHNHPSGQLNASVEDHRITDTIAEAGKLLDIRLADHIIVSHRGFKSLREEEYFLSISACPTVINPHR